MHLLHRWSLTGLSQSINLKVIKKRTLRGWELELKALDLAPSLSSKAVLLNDGTSQPPEPNTAYINSCPCRVPGTSRSFKAESDTLLPQSVTLFKPYTHMHPCIIICSGWLSWLLVTNALSLECVSIFIEHHHPSWGERFTHAHPATPRLPLSRLQQDFSLTSNCVILVQGTPNILNLIPYNWLSNHLCLNFTELPEDFRSFPILHVACGGVMDRYWIVASNRPILWTAFAPVSWQVYHVVDPTSLHRAFPRCCPPPHASG